jgi:hypothetical protein
MNTTPAKVRRQRVFGDQERVLVDGEPGKVVASPMRHCYVVELDTGECVDRVGSTITPIPPVDGICDACGDESSDLQVINVAPAAGACICKTCLEAK